MNTITYHCNTCGNEVETPENEIAYCPEHPDAVIDSVVTERLTTYQISRNNDTLFSVQADTYESAATIAARKLYGRRATALRTTGDTGKSGYFVAYEYDRRHHCQNSLGDAFHVM